MNDARAVARALGVLPAVAARWIRRGMPVEVDAARAWLAQRAAGPANCEEAEKPGTAKSNAGDVAGEPHRSLVEERTRLFREQADAVALKNAIARREYAPIRLLAKVLATASQAVSERFDHLPGVLKKSCPEMTSAQRNEVVGVIVAARNEWVRATVELVAARLDELESEDEPAKDLPQ